MRYTLYQTGPDNKSTWQECWGSTATSPGREIAAAPTLVGLIEAVEKLSHDNWWIRGPGGKSMAGSRRDFFALPTVAREQGRRQKAE